MSQSVAELPYARMLAAGAVSGHESSAGLQDDDARAKLQSDYAAQLHAEFLTTLDGLNSQDSDGTDARRAVAARIEGVVDKVARNDLTTLDPEDRVTLEALVRIKDRPAYRTTNGNIDFNDPLRGEWGGFLFGLVDVPDFARSVGRIDLDGQHMGTGFVIGPDRIMTNLHVLEGIAEKRPDGWHFGGDATIEFSDAPDGSAPHRIDAVITAGPTLTKGRVDLANLDMAILRVGGVLPPPLPFASSPAPVTDVMVIGYPARPGTSAMMDPGTKDFSIDMAKRLKQIFGARYGTRYVAPGRISTAAGKLAGDPRNWAFSHDCTTLGGNSGSCVVQLNSTDGIIAVTGLHFSGAPLIANYAHSMAAVAAETGDLDALNWVAGQ